MSKKINVDFYRVEILGNNSVTFESLIKSVGSSANDASRTIDINHSPTRLQEFREYPNFCDGNMMRIRMDEIPSVASVDGDIAPINFDDDEGLGEETAFLYQILTKVLMLQRNKFGVSASSFTKYFIAKSEIQIRLSPVLQADVIGRMGKMQTIKKFEVSIAKTSKMTSLQGQDFAVDEIIKLNSHFHSDSINLEVSIGKEEGKTLSIQNIISSVKTFFDHANSQQLGDIKSIKVSGDSENGTPEFLDLLEDWVRESIEINPVDIRRIEYKERAQALRDSWINRRDLLEEMFLN